MYPTLQPNEIPISHPSEVIHETILKVITGDGAATTAHLSPASTDLNAWARHAGASNGFADAITGL